VWACGIGSASRSCFDLGRWWCGWRLPGAHADLCDLTEVGHLASFGLPYGEGPGRHARCGVTLQTGTHPARADNVSVNYWTVACPPEALALTGAFKWLSVWWSASTSGHSRPGALVVRVSDGAELAVAEHPYRHGVIEDALPGSGAKLGRQWALQDPVDWVDAIGVSVRQALVDTTVDPAQVIGMATDFTACTVLPTTADGTPLCVGPAWRGRPHAWPKLWKHHAAQPYADRINELAHARGER